LVAQYTNVSLVGSLAILQPLSLIILITKRILVLQITVLRISLLADTLLLAIQLKGGAHLAALLLVAIPLRVAVAMPVLERSTVKAVAVFDSRAQTKIEAALLVDPLPV